MEHKARSKNEEMALLYLMWATGLDLEDMRVSWPCLEKAFFPAMRLDTKILRLLSGVLAALLGAGSRKSSLGHTVRSHLVN